MFMWTFGQLVMVGFLNISVYIYTYKDIYVCI